MKRKPSESCLKDFLYLEKELLLSTHIGWRDELMDIFNYVKSGKGGYPNLFRWVYFLVLNDYSTFKSMDEIYLEIEKKKYYDKYPDESTGYKYRFTPYNFKNNNSDENENKILHTSNQ